MPLIDLQPGGKANITDVNENFKYICEDGWVTENRMGDASVTARAIQDGAVDDFKIGFRTIVDTTTPTSDTNSLQVILSGLAHIIKSITGKSSWRYEPTKNIDQLNQSIVTLETDVDELQENVSSLLDDKTVDDSIVPTANTATLNTLLSNIVNRLKAITGKSDWITSPAITLESISNPIVSEGTASIGSLSSHVVELSHDPQSHCFYDVSVYTGSSTAIGYSVTRNSAKDMISFSNNNPGSVNVTYQIRKRTY